MYCNSVTGSDSNDGSTPTKAKLTIDGARTALGAVKATIKVFAPSTSPIQTFADFSSGDITIEPTVSGSVWYGERVASFTSGWSSVGGGVYSRADGGVTAPYLWVETLTDGDGFVLRLNRNESTPTTPAAGELGQSGGNYYVHLPGDANPNSHTIKRQNTSYLIRISGTAKVTVKNAVLRYAGGNMVECTSATAQMNCISCLAQYGNGNGFGNTAGNVYVERCVSQRHTNDGFNWNGGVVTEVFCEGSYNADEGSSPHGSTRHNVSNGRYHHNNHGGYTAINSCIVSLTDCEFDNNGLVSGGAQDRGGINLVNTVSGSITRCNTHDNTGEGLNCGTSATVIVTSLTSTNNSIADVICD